MCVCIYPCIYLSVRLPGLLSVYRSVDVPIHLSIPVCPSIHPCHPMPIFLAAIYQSICLSTSILALPPTKYAPSASIRGLLSIFWFLIKRCRTSVGSYYNLCMESSMAASIKCGSCSLASFFPLFRESILGALIFGTHISTAPKSILWPLGLAPGNSASLQNQYDKIVKHLQNRGP